MKILEDRLIAFLDVLGFSNLLTSHPLSEVHIKYSSFIDQAKTKTFFKTEGDNSGRTNFAFAQFLSDSLVLVSNPIDDVYHVNSFIAAVHFLLEIGFMNNLPLRGAIGRGNFLVDDERNIFLSERFPELVKLEANQEWTGCVIADSAESIVLESIFGKCTRNDFLEHQLRNNPVHLYEIPTKKIPLKLLAINFLFFLTEAQIKSGINYLIEPKKQNMLKYFDFLISLPIEIQSLQPEFYPAIELKAMKTRSGMRSIFLDENGNPCQPGIKEFQWVAVGRWRE